MTDLKKYAYKVSAAGRVNIIGEHIDYCGGKVMPAALSLKNTVYVRPNGTDKINLSWTTLPGSVSFDIASLGSYRDMPYGKYQAGSAFLWQRAGHKIVGCDMLQDCTVPFGSGLSSSAAIEVSTIAALATVAGEPFDRAEVALTAQAAEREYAGVNCGIMDQYASACGKKGMAMLLDCKTLECEYIPFELGGWSLVITDCKKPHNLVESKYNERRAETEEAFAVLKEHVPSAACLADITPGQFARFSRLLPAVIKKRAATILKDGKIPFMIGGEHLVTLGAFSAAAEKYPEVHIIHFDAHADLMLESTDPEGTIAKFIEKRGEGVHHVAFATTGVQTALDELSAKGVQLIDKAPRKGAEGLNIAFLHPKSTHGVLTEICEDPSKK